ncbi:hypothetical protein RFA01_001833 [Campylobacter coli]|nr:hypothetical protein [Campylobacter coli]
MNQEIKNVEVPMNENTYKKWQRVPKDMQEKAIEAALTMLWRDEVFFYTFFNGHIEEGEIRIEAKREEKMVKTIMETFTEKEILVVSIC